MLCSFCTCGVFGFSSEQTFVSSMLMLIVCHGHGPPDSCVSLQDYWRECQKLVHMFLASQNSQLYCLSSVLPSAKDVQSHVPA
jgi:hypothetical protein